MPKRTIAVKHLRCHKKHRPNEACDFAVLPDHADLLHLVHGLVKGVDRDQLRDEEQQRYATIEDIKPDGRTLMVEMTAGPFGEQGANRNVHSHEITHSHGADEAHTVMTRVFLVVPNRGSSALLFMEYASGSSAGATLLKLLHRAWSARYSDWILSTETVVEPQAWLNLAQLEEVTAVQYSWSADIADASQSRVVGVLKRTLVPPHGQKVFPQYLLGALRERRVHQGRLLGFVDGDDPDELEVRLTRDGRSKKMMLEQEKTPAVRFVFSDANDPEKSAEEFMAFCLDEVQAMFQDVGVEWQDSWRSGPWSDEALAVSMTVPEERTDE